MTFTITDFYNALKQAIMFSPQHVDAAGKVWKCRQLQTFRVMQLEKGAEINSPNMGATICDKGKPYFFSRKWHESKYKSAIEVEYPALLLTEINFNVEKSGAFQKRTKRCYNFELTVLDNMTTDCETCACDSCGKRVVSEIFADTEALLFDALYYLSKVKGAVTKPGDVEVIANTDFLEYQKENGIISSFNATADFGGLLNGQAVAGYRVSIDAQKKYGTAVTFTVCFQNCEATEFNFNLPDFGVLAKEAGCQTCG